MYKPFYSIINNDFDISFYLDSVNSLTEMKYLPILVESMFNEKQIKINVLIAFCQCYKDFEITRPYFTAGLILDFDLYDQMDEIIQILDLESGRGKIEKEKIDALKIYFEMNNISYKEN